MSIKVPDRKALWGRSGNRCAFPTCRAKLFETEDELAGIQLAGDGITVGEEAHIRAQNPGGARFDESYEGVDAYANLVLLCPTHHTVIDNAEVDDWSVERIEKLKADHEQWVQERLSAEDVKALQTGLLVAADVQWIEDRIFERWPTAYYQLSMAIPCLNKEHYGAINEVGLFLLAKDWPSAYPGIATSADRLRRVIALLADLVVETFEPVDGLLKLVREEKRLADWDETAYKVLFHETQLRMVTSWWLADTITLELNQWIRAVRDELDPHYRFSEGVVLVPVGDGIVRSVALSRFGYDHNYPLPVLPSTVAQIKACVERDAIEQGVDPQSVNPALLSFAPSP